MKRMLGAGLMALALVVVLPLSASAAILTGAFSKTGAFTPVNGATGATVGLGASTGLDFIPFISAPGTKTPGVAGDFEINTAEGDFAAMGFQGAEAKINDFSFAGAGSANYPLAPISPLEFNLPSGVTFHLNSVGITFQNANSLVLDGLGYFLHDGDQTPGTFTFSGNQAGGTFSFSASQAAIPEPGSLLLFATGLFGFAAAARRRMAR